jgi:hypothetical protein
VKAAGPPAAFEKIEALLANPAVYELADVLPIRDPVAGGRPCHYPRYMALVYAALVSVFRSARQVEAELAHPLVWKTIRRTVSSAFPSDPSKHLPPRPMRRHHYLYMRNRYLADPDVMAAFGAKWREVASRHARDVGLLDEHGSGSWTHPDLERLLHADGKVIAPLFRAKPGDRRVDKVTGEVRVPRHESDAGLHFEGDGEAAWGTKFVLVAARGPRSGSRIILDIEPVERPGTEATVAMRCFRRIAPLVPGAQGVVYDTALRGVHHQELLRELGLLPVNRVTAAVKGASEPRRKDGRRVARNLYVEDKVVDTPEGQMTVPLYARDGSIGVIELDDRGDKQFEPLSRLRTHRNRDKNGRFRWYNDYALPDRLGGSTITVRLHGNEGDRARKLNRTEHVRPIPPSDPDFERLYARRNDSESINRHLEDTLFLGRAHSVGRYRQHVDLLGYALMVNGLSLLRSRRRTGSLPDVA